MQLQTNSFASPTAYAIAAIGHSLPQQFVETIDTLMKARGVSDSNANQRLSILQIYRLGGSPPPGVGISNWVQMLIDHCSPQLVVEPTCMMLASIATMLLLLVAVDSVANAVRCARH